MSERPPIVPSPASDSPPPPGPPPERSGCATAFMLVAGIILLVPGVLCAILLSGFRERGDDIFSNVSFSLGGCGLILIFYALLRKRI
jgi:hypothetical protein